MVRGASMPQETRLMCISKAQSAQHSWIMGVQKNFNQAQVAIVEQGNEERENLKHGD